MMLNNQVIQVLRASSSMANRTSHTIVESFRISEYENKIIEKLMGRFGFNRSELIRYAITRLASEKLQEAQGW